MNDRLAEALVPETWIGKRFLRSKTWTDKVLEIALPDLVRLLRRDDLRFPVVADLGCGCGRSLRKLDDRFHPGRLIAMDIDAEMLDAAAGEAESNALDNCGMPAQFEFEDRPRRRCGRPAVLSSNLSSPHLPG